MSQNANNPNNGNKKTWLIVTSVVSAAIIILGIAFIYIWQHIKSEQEKENLQQEMEKIAQQTNEQNQLSSADIRERVNRYGADILGTYTAGGDIIYDEDAWSFTSIELKEDLTATVVTAHDGIGKNGWWTCNEIDGVYIITLAVQDKPNPVLYQVHDSYLIAMDSIYTQLSADSSGNMTFVKGDDNGKMEMQFYADGKASAEFKDTNSESENSGLTYLMSGNYTMDGDVIDITLNEADSKFLKFEFETADYGKVSAIASLFFKKQ